LGVHAGAKFIVLKREMPALILCGIMDIFVWFVIGFLAVASAERIWERRYSDRAKRGERRMPWCYTAMHSLHIVIFVATGVECFWLRRAPVWAVTAAGLVLFVVAVTVRLTAVRTLGKFWSLHLEIRADHQLVTEGIYSYMRHPAYAAIVLEMIAVPLVGNSYGTLALAVFGFVPLLLLRWQREEKEMIAKFGEQYERYRQVVPAFVPWRGRAWRQPAAGERLN
jgi:protein-S-isoprenylcysteine O-methyltransferase Ste14